MDNFTNMYYTGSYPANGDSTASGGYGSSKNVWSDKIQRGHADEEPDNGAGLVGQSVSSGPVGNEVQDAKQGMDGETREQYAHEANRDFGRETKPEGLSPSTKNSDTEDKEQSLLSYRHGGSDTQ